MSNWEHANEADIDAARDAYTLDDPKHPDAAGDIPVLIFDESITAEQAERIKTFIDQVQAQARKETIMELAEIEHPDFDYLGPDPNDPMGGEAWGELKEDEPMELAPIEPDQEIILFTGNPAERMRQMQETAAILAEPVRQRHTVTISGTGARQG